MDIDCDGKNEIELTDSNDEIKVNCDIDNDGVNEIEVNVTEKTVKCNAGLFFKAIFSKLCGKNK
jgi:hypothetical protein